MKKRDYFRFHIGDEFSRMTIVGMSGGYAECVCRCGNVKTVRKYSLRNGNIKSCGCFHKEIVSLVRTTHGMSNTKTYSSWYSMIQRCTNKNNINYAKYGGRGISVCKEWMESFVNFVSDMGSRPTGKTIDRVDVNGNYEPSNCRWATQAEQNKNKRKIVVWTIHGKKYDCLKDASLDLGVSIQTISNWCVGYTSKKGKLFPPKVGCSVNKILGFA